MPSTITKTSLANLPVRRGKVRDLYDLGDQLLLVSTDRISAFDWVLPTGIPDKGRVLTQLSRFWFERLDVPNHMLSCNVENFNLPAGVDRAPLVGRSMLVRKAEVVPIECVVRGYLTGSGWKEYQATARCGIGCPGLREATIAGPIFTPATKAEVASMTRTLRSRCARGLARTAEGCRRSVELYTRGRNMPGCGITADTKFEFGLFDGELILIDEVLTPDSSRFWPTDKYEPGHGQPSFDKQFVRDWLSQTGWDKNSPPPELPADVVNKTRAKYIEAFER
jgi:phosphoribosylaminoimidazole-succinocarboxamide synthase